MLKERKVKKNKYRNVVVGGNVYEIPDPCKAGTCFMDCPLYDCGKCLGGFGHKKSGFGFGEIVRNLYPGPGCPWHGKSAA